MTQSTVEVSPVKPAAKYIGGKSRLAGRICPIIESTPHDGYAEPFVGMGGVFLRRRRRPSSEFINDASGDVANFFRVLQEHYPYFIDLLRFRVASRSEFERLAALPPARLTDLQRAARFLYLQRLGFGGKPGSNFGVDSRASARFNVTRLEPLLADIHERLAGVLIEQLDYAEFIRRYDRAGMLFYLDPPYWGSEDDYGKNLFGRGEFEKLAGQLAELRGRFIMSINDRPEVRECFGAFHQLEVETTYTMGVAHTGAGQRAGELLVSNFPIALT